MTECFEMLTKYSSRLRQLHISDVTSDSTHVPLNLEAIRSYRKIASFIPPTIPIIIESPIEENRIEEEIKRVLSVFSNIEYEMVNPDEVEPTIHYTL